MKVLKTVEPVLIALRESTMPRSSIGLRVAFVYVVIGLAMSSICPADRGEDKKKEILRLSISNISFAYL